MEQKKINLMGQEFDLGVTDLPPIASNEEAIEQPARAEDKLTPDGHIKTRFDQPGKNYTLKELAAEVEAINCSYGHDYYHLKVEIGKGSALSYSAYSPNIQYVTAMSPEALLKALHSAHQGKTQDIQL